MFFLIDMEMEVNYKNNISLLGIWLGWLGYKLVLTESGIRTHNNIVTYSWSQSCEWSGIPVRGW